MVLVSEKEQVDPSEPKAKKVRKNQFSECGKGFKRPDGLKKHLLTHKPESRKNFPCQFKQCGKSFKLKQQLESHLKVHSDKTFITVSTVKLISN